MIIKTSIYNKKHKRLFEQNSQYPTLKEFEDKEQNISTEDFLTYCLFKEQKHYDGYKTFSDFKKKLPGRIDLLSDYLNLDSPTITANFPDAQTQQIVTEHVGIGAGLSIISSLHGLTEADWNIIPVTKTKDLDYSIQVSSDGKNIIEVECKGTFEDPAIKSPSISNMRKHIENKKTAQREGQGNDNLLYGVITSYCNDIQKTAHSRLLDPISDNNYEDPEKLRLLSRLYFYLQELNNISKSHFLIALSSRLQTLRVIDNAGFDSLNDVPLIKADGEPFTFPVSYEFGKTRIPQFSAFANVYKVGGNKYFLYGFCDEIVSTIIKQNYSKITKMSFVPKTIQTSIAAKIPKKDVEKDTYFHDASAGFVEQRLYGKAIKTSAGRVFGIFRYGSDKKDIKINR